MRITARNPASARPVRIRAPDVPTTWLTVAEAPDFSVPDANQDFPERDPNDGTRAIRPGEVFILTPIKARNKTAVTAWIEARIKDEDGSTVLLERITVPANESVNIVTQGLSLLKRNAVPVYGDQLQFRAEQASTFDLSGAAQEQLSNEHIGVQ